MKAEELRIGNWYKSVKFGCPVVCELSDLHELYHRADGAYNYPPIYEVFEPIPLTEEWLLKLGFSKIHESETYDVLKVSYIDDEYAYWITGLYLLSKNGDRWCFYQYTDEDTGFEIHSDVKYVHQLQNLYYALTGEEL